MMLAVVMEGCDFWMVNSELEMIFSNVFIQLDNIILDFLLLPGTSGLPCKACFPLICCCARNRMDWRPLLTKHTNIKFLVSDVQGLFTMNKYCNVHW